MIAWAREALALLLVLAGFQVGGLFARRYEERVRQLSALAAVLRQLAAAIGYAQEPLPDLLDSLASGVGGGVGDLLLAWRSHLLNGEGGVEGALLEALEERRERLAFLEEDRALLRALARGLGNTDRRQQVRHLEWAQERAQGLEARARESSRTHARMARTLGVTSALGIAILLL